MPKIYIIIYSLYGHILTLAHGVKEGLEAQGAEVKLFQVPETLPEEVLTKMHAPPKSNIPIVSVSDLPEADGIFFGIPTRFGTMPEQFKAFLDATGSLWSSGALAGKFAGIFTSTSTQHGGHETTILTTVTYLAHHGMLFVPVGVANAKLFEVDAVNGGSPYGAGTITGADGSRQPSKDELAIAYSQGEEFAKLINTFQNGIIANATADAAADARKSEATIIQANETTRVNKNANTPERATLEVDELPKRKGIWRFLCCA